MITSKINSLYELIYWCKSKYGLNRINKSVDLSPIHSNSCFAGFIDAHGSFSIFINNKSIRFRFSITQTGKSKLGLSKKKKIMNLLAEFFKVMVSKYELKRHFFLQLKLKTQSIISNALLISYINKFPVLSSKYLKYKDWFQP